MANKSCEIDPIPTALLKEVLPSVSGPITSMVNNSITTGIFAQSWKTAIICSLLKKVDLALQLSNFRSFSNLSSLSHGVECAILHPYSRHCKDKDLISGNQSAYCANYSYETALVKIVNDILWAMESQKVSALMAIDLRTQRKVWYH